MNTCSRGKSKDFGMVGLLTATANTCTSPVTYDIDANDPAT